MEIEAWAKNRLSGGATERVRTLICGYLRLASYAPLQSLRILGLKLAGSKIGEDLVLAHGARVFSPWKLSIGSHTNIGNSVYLDARGRLSIGDNCNISSEAAIWTAEHDIQCPEFAMTRAPVVIANRAWVCFRAIVMPGVTVGEGAVVASGAVVTKDVAPFTVVAGVPAKAIGKRSSDLTFQLGNRRK